MTDTWQERVVAGAPAAKRKSVKIKPVWVGPTAEDFAYGQVLCFDQTLTKTGAVVLLHDAAGLWVVSAGMITPTIPEGLTSHEQTLQKAVSMDTKIGAMIMTLAYSVNAIVHEMPALFGHRTESSLMAAMAIRTNAKEHARGVEVVMIGKQEAAKLLTGKRDATKAEVKVAVEALIPPENRSNAKHWNQDITDAAAVGLAHLYRTKVKP